MAAKKPRFFLNLVLSFLYEDQTQKYDPKAHEAAQHVLR